MTVNTRQASADTGAIVGAQLMCAGAGEMIGEFASAISNGFTVTQFLRAVCPHPTYNEALIDALRSAVGKGEITARQSK